MSELKKPVKRVLSGLLLSSIITAGFLFQSPASELKAADLCSLSCERYVECAPEIMKKNPTEQQKNTLLQGCLNSCKNPKLKKGIIACYTKNKDQCTTFFQCLVSTGQHM